MRTADWVCLIYHDIIPVAVPRGGGREWFAVTAAGFGHQLDLIRAAGYRGRSIAEAIADDTPAIAISFDDGVRSDYELAFPALASRGMTATFFVVTDRMGTPGYVTWSELREMRAAGMSIQSHTRSHPFLSELDATRLRDELAGSKAKLDDALGQNTDQIAFPGGDAPRPRFRPLIEEAGYRIVGTSRWGRNGATRSSGPTFIRRCTIAGQPDDTFFRRVLRADRSLGLKRRVREVVLSRLRATLGPSRYAAWRRVVLNGLREQTGRS